MLLTDFAPFNQLYGVFEHRGIITPISQGFPSQGLISDMVAIDAFMYLSQYVVGIFFPNAFDKGGGGGVGWCGKTSFIKGSS